MSLGYRRAHCWNNVAIKAQVKLITKLNNQSQLTQTADVGAVNEAAELVNDRGMTTGDLVSLESG